jgi:hypothetical protein
MRNDVSNAGLTRSAVAGLAVAVTLVLSACGGGGKSPTASGAKTSPPDPKAVDVAQFCRDYTMAANNYESSGGDVDSPDFIAFETSLTAAQKVAPAPVAANVTSMVDEVKKIDAADSAGKAVSADLGKWSAPVAAWANTNCAAATTTTSDTTSDDSARSDSASSDDLCFPNGNPPLDSDTPDSDLVPCPNG